MRIEPQMTRMEAIRVICLGFFPELEPPASVMVTNQVDGDPHEPCHRAAVSPESVPMFIGLPEAILSQCLRQIPIPHGNEHESQHACTVPFDKTVKVFQFEHRAFHGHGDEPGCRRFLHIRIDVGIRVELNK